MMKTLILTDNVYALALARELDALHGAIEVCQSPKGPLGDVPRLNVKTQVDEIVQRYNLVISIHCKQLFPAALIQQVRCINVHPGYNPYNRGWFPQVFSIMNGLKAGVTIHEIDEQLDHGAIIVQQEYKIESWDTSGTAYAKIMQLERDLVLRYFADIRAGNYQTTRPMLEGNLNFKKDFDRLKQIDLDEQGRFGDFLNRLRAYTHGDFQNAYFIDADGKKVYVRVSLEREG